MPLVLALAYPFAFAQAQLGDSIEGIIECRDTVHWDTNRQMFIPRKFPIDVTLRNNSDTAMALYPSAEIDLPPGVVLAPTTQPLHVKSSTPLGPRKIVTFTWWVFVDSSYFESGADSIRAIIDFKDPDLPPATQLITELCAHAPFIKQIVSIPMLDVTCTLRTMDSVGTFNDTLLAPEELLATCWLFNTGTVPIKIGRASLFITELGSGAIVPPYDRHRYVSSPIHPGDSVEFTWGIDVLKLMYNRTVDIRVVVFDTLDYEQSVCTETFFIPEIRGLSCKITGPDLMRMNYATGRFEPDSIAVTMHMRNHFDSLQFVPEAEIYLTNAPHLTLSKFCDPIQRKSRIEHASEVDFTWILKVGTPPTKRTEQQIDFSSTFYKYPGKEYCSHIVVFEDPAPHPSCYIDMPDTIRLSGYDHDPPVFTVNYSIANPKDSVFPAQRLLLDIGEGLSTAQPIEIILGEMEPHETRHASWTVHTNRSRFARTSQLYVIAYDGNGNELLRCGRTYSIPAMPADLVCSMSGIDSVHYDSHLMQYVPSEFNFVASLSNILDTVLSNVSATFSTGKSRFFTVGIGQTRTQIVPSIGPGGEFAFGWTALINGVATAYVTDTLHVDVSIDNDGINRDFKLPVVVAPKRLLAVGDVPPAETVQLGIAFPNPFTSETGIPYYLPSAMPVQFTVFNMLGQVAQHVLDAYAPPGNQMARISGLPPGIYTVVLRTPKGTLTRQIIAQ